MNEKGEMAGSSLYKTEIIAKLFGVGPRRIQQMTKDGILPAVETPKSRRYDLVPTIQTYADHCRSDHQQAVRGLWKRYALVHDRQFH